MRLMKHTLAGSLVVAVAVAMAPAAAAEPGDDTFVDAMISQGIVRERGALVATGKNVCADLKQVAESGPGLIPTPLQVMSALHVLPAQADFVVSVAKRTYCPEFT